MPKFKEDLLQFVWRHRLLKPIPLFCHSGSEISIIKPGELNVDSGPDFFNAHIRLNDLVLAGNVEIHLKTSDWLKHKHQDDKTYDTIILHAVYEHDVDLEQNKKHQVEILELKHYIAPETIRLYEQLAATKDKLACAAHLKEVNEFKFISWLERMCTERLEYKVKTLQTWFSSYYGDYTQTFYTALLRNFGFKVNALPFELIAKQLPVNLLLKHADNLLQVEALLFGTAGLLDEQFEDKYILQLQNEFEFLKNKYQLISLKKELFKYSKLRPANFPTLRLAQFAQLLHSNPQLFLNPHQFNTSKELKNALNIQLQGYWKNHYSLDAAATFKDLTFGKTSVENLIINSFAPFYFFYGKKLAKEEFTQLALDLLADCAPEENQKTKLFAVKKEQLKSAADTQALINLYDNYCVSKSCLKCGIAASILKAV